jgi:sulfide dehydrogenase [flavocytochrome c] flavoprotein subunit
MATLSRREFLALAAATGFGGVFAPGRGAGAAVPARVVVVGGGVGGATLAKYLRRLAPGTDVTLVETRPAYVTGFASNWVIAGLRSIDSITHGYDALARRHGVKVVTDRATELDPARRRVRTAGGLVLAYDRCVVAPGVALRWHVIEGYGESAAQACPHAWKAGPQTEILRRQLEAMADGGLFVLSVPAPPYACPPAPYERASLVAHYLKTHKPRAKVLILDANQDFPGRGLFQRGWDALYPGMIEWRPGAGLVAVDARRKVARTASGEVRADVLNVIPPQRTGAVAEGAGLTDASGWCPVDPRSWESRRHPGVHVIGDAADGGELPKSGFSASSQAKVCAVAVSALLRGQELPQPSWTHACYSLVGPEHGVSDVGIYALGPQGRIVAVPGAGGASPPDGNPRMEAIYAESWYRNMVDDIFG